MTRRRIRKAHVSGILNINKPSGITSHDVVAHVRRLTGEKKVGHAGTLDPMATGVLLLCLGQATRVVEFLMAGRKTYRAVIRLGAATDTYDAEGTITQSVDSFRLTQKQITTALVSCLGVIQQVPPPYSAIRKNGQRLYKLARKGVAVQVPPRRVEIDSIDLIAWQSPHLTLEVTCSPGTYIRSLASDVGQKLGVGGHLSALTRLASGEWRLEEAITLDDFEVAVQANTWTDFLHPLDSALQSFERVNLTGDMAHRVTQGQPIPLDEPPQTSLVRAYDPDGSFVAVMQPTDKPLIWHPKKVFQVQKS